MNIRLESSPLATKNLAGVGNYTKLLAEALDKNDSIDLELTNFNFLNRQPTPSVNTKHPSVENRFIPLKIYAKLQSYGIAPPFDMAKKPVDLTIFTNYATWPTINSKYTAVVIHDLTYLHFPEVVEEKNLAHLMRVVPRSLKKADIILTVSQIIKSELVNEFNIDPEQIVVTTIPPADFFKTKNSADVFSKYDIKTEKYIYSIGTVEPRKDIPTLINAYLMLPKKIRQQYSLVIAGGMGWKSDDSKKAIDNAIKNQGNVKYLGYIDQDMSNALHQQANLHVSTSTYEGFGMPVLESIASGTMAVLSDIPVYREVGGDISLFANVKDPQDFAKKIELALTKDEYDKYFTENYKKHLATFSWDNNVESIIKKVKELK